ncbi:multidrug efflux SMR transporter [Ferrimonas sp. YFM]|uniref:DMT family transporter n=1 Tax=Ferrimonas sp. YFM TaxID=3028878 RepID=UPI0025725AEF|nr:multidrug efflux SMR transporter [Ferrimonas sp. YFM]
MHWLFLFLGVAAEALSHVALKATDGFSKPSAIALVGLGHLCAFVALSFAMKGVPVGIVHGLWAALAILGVNLLSMLVYQEHLDLTTWIGMGLIVAGVLVVNLGQGHAH